MKQDQELKKRLRADSERLKRAERRAQGAWAYLAYLGTLGIVFILPVVGGAYLGLWLDNRAADYSVSWTTGLLLLGVAVGAMNVYLLIRRGS